LRIASICAFELGFNKLLPSTLVQSTRRSSFLRLVAQPGSSWLTQCSSYSSRNLDPKMRIEAAPVEIPMWIFLFPRRNVNTS
jgi:hypothetical protein